MEPERPGSPEPCCEPIKKHRLSKLKPCCRDAANPEYRYLKNGSSKPMFADRWIDKPMCIFKGR